MVNQSWYAQWLRALAFAVIGLAATSAHSASKTVLVLGDSLSAEYGLARGAGWVALLENRLKPTGFAVMNASISGDTSSGGKSRLPALLEKYHPAVVIIELGGNDGLRGLPLASSETNFRAMIAAAQQAKAKVLLVGMRIPPNYGRAYTEKFFGLYTKLAKDTGAARVPFLLEGIVDKPQLFQPDQIHPTATAHPIMLENVWLYLKPLLK